jgi:hypothetical protein
MKNLIGAAIVTACLTLGGPAVLDSTAQAARVTAQAAGPVDATDISARRRSHRDHYRYAYRAYDPVYYDRPYYYRPYPYLLPAPFTFGFGFGPWWWASIASRCGGRSLRQQHDALPAGSGGGQQGAARSFMATAEMNRAPVRRPIVLEKFSAQSQFLNFQGLSFQGVSVSIRHCDQRSGGQWLRREVSFSSGSMTRGIIRRLVWRVAAAIISTNSDFSPTAGSSPNASPT